MKNVFSNTKKGILMVAMMATVMGFANDGELIVKDAKRTSLTFKNVKEGNSLTIKDANGLTLYKELIKKSGVYSKGFDLRALPDGIYFFELEKDVEIKTIPFSVSHNKVTFNKESETLYNKPIVVVKKDMLYITKIDSNYEPFTISLFGKNSGELLYTETVTNTCVIEKVYKLKAGNYKLVLNSNNKYFTKFINN
ncbi:hypothetical protein E1J38_003775 [Seonamhaeicola sediminis]|uniref:T9SS type A sorting domain-containing protein n=1 Tax=Seonamhaeicola sediminis TaxID=2528206 RepID=A0A562YG96_9FLAO|nr:hypothetical protein [Seonamhaeicola sediminis]TWO33903.1 hypothetical protein E1J38_003775 [Seonamhaeicola sediminis]